MSIPSFQDWDEKRRVSPTVSHWSLKRSGQMVGILSLGLKSEQKKGEIRTVGVLPEFRGQGFGKRLLQFGVSQLTIQGMHFSVLTVSGQNRAALQLYENLGFKVEDHYQVFQWNRDS